MVRRVVIIVRLVAAVIFVAASVEITWQSILSFIMLLVTLFAVDGHTDGKGSNSRRENPFKYIKLTELCHLDRDEHNTIKEKVLNYVMYDAENCEVLAKFEQLKHRSECIFAKNSRLWASVSWNEHLSFELNVTKTLPTFVYFSSLCSRMCVDGFVFELPGTLFGGSPQMLGIGVRRLLKILSDNDPGNSNCMHRHIRSRNWVFEFNKMTFFITTFAPCYPETSSRYSFESDACFVLFQPEVSFARHDLPPDTSFTNWHNPNTVRDRIRIAFREAGRGYDVREPSSYPMAEEIVKPVRNSNESVIWWEGKDDEISCRVFNL